MRLLLVRNMAYISYEAREILHRFWARTRFMCSWPHPYSTLILGVFPLHQIAVCWASTSAWALSCLDVQLFSKNSNLEDARVNYHVLLYAIILQHIVHCILYTSYCILYELMVN